MAEFFGLEELKNFCPATEDPGKNPVRLDFAGKNQSEIAALIQRNYPIFTDDAMLRTSPSDFEEIRKHYDYRAEFYTELTI